MSCDHMGYLSMFFTVIVNCIKLAYSRMKEFNNRYCIAGPKLRSYVDEQYIQLSYNKSE